MLHACVIHQNINRACVGLECINRLARCGGIGDIKGQCQNICASRAQLFGCFFKALCIAGIEHHLRPCRAEALGQGKSNPH